jgi:hypothetical protein
MKMVYLYKGSLCEITIPTEVGDPCVDHILCTEEGQICSSNEISRATGVCLCETGIGYIQDDFLPSETYGECVGPVPSCDVDSDCVLKQECTEGFCTCIDLPGVGEMCLKGDNWVCVVDPLEVDPCEKNPIGPCGFYGICFATGTDNADQFTCECVDHWFGDLCDQYVHCEPNPCENNGLCSDKGNHFECECTEDWSGKICDQSACDKNPCGLGTGNNSREFIAFKKQICYLNL